jgi:NCAIR mutase (PurE)-related protein
MQKKKHKLSGFEDLGFAKVDHHRIHRKGFPEVIFCPGKSPEQIAKIAQRIARQGHDVLATRADAKVFRAVKKVLRDARFYPTAKIIINRTLVKNCPASACNQELSVTSCQLTVAIVTAGTADIPVAEEAAVTAEFLGLKVERIFDVGVAGVHRLIKNLPRINRAKVIIVAAGMEGALPSVLGGLTDRPIIAVPTSVGYGANFKGLSALLTMLNTCAPGVAVVNIDNGFGAAVMAYTIIRPKTKD